MKAAVVCCLLVCAIVATQAFYVKPHYNPYPIYKGGCRDFTGHFVYPGHSYWDGCNTCVCGRWGKPTMCTLMACNVYKPKPVLY